MTTVEKLLIHPGTTLWFSPIEWLHMLGPLPAGVRMAGDPAGSTVSVVFVSNAATVRWLANTHRGALPMVPTLWICYPTAGRPDFTREYLLATVGAHGLRPIDETAFDAGWSALRFGRLAPGEVAFARI